MKMIKSSVVSSNISDAGHEGETLYLRFKSGGVYSYDGVPRGVYDAIVRAESPGKFFHRFVKGKYRYHRLERDPFATSDRARPH